MHSKKIVHSAATTLVNTFTHVGVWKYIFVQDTSNNTHTHTKACNQHPYLPAQELKILACRKCHKLVGWNTEENRCWLLYLMKLFILYFVFVLPLCVSVWV